MSFSPLLNELILALRCLPGVGPKSAQRMALHLLDQNRDAALHLAQSLQKAVEQINYCEKCRNLSEVPLCQLCQDPRRDSHALCIVETPADVLAIEQTSIYRGQYFILRGRLSPLDGLGPSALGLDSLLARCQNESVEEVILATNLTVEGEATAHYITSMLKNLPIKITRIAHGVPLGGELEYVDGGTLARALTSRATVANSSDR